MSSLKGAIEKVANAYRTGLTSKSSSLQTWKKFSFDTGYYNQIGLIYHDVMPHTPVVKEACRRLPRDIQEARDFRIARAFLLNGNKQILPKEEWTKQEEDIPYMNPYIDLVKKENNDRSDWDHFENAEQYS